MSEQLNETVDNAPESSVNPFAEESWADGPVNAEENGSVDYYENESEPGNDYDEGDDGDEQVEQSESPSFKYENEVSEKIHQALLENKYDEIYSFLEQKSKFEKLSKAEINNRSIAEEIVKSHMKSQYKDLTDDEINFKFNRQYSIPKEPVQSLTEDDEEFAERKQEWEQKVKDIDMELMIQAKTVKPELLKNQQEIKLPSLGKAKSPEDMATEKAYIENYLSTAQSTINDFDGIGIDYKDEGMSFTSSYIPSNEEKQEVANIMESLANAEFDANMIFAERWVNQDYTLNTKQMAEDLWFFQNKDRIIQKLVNDSVSKRMSEYRKQTSNISVGGNQANFTPNGEQSESDKMAEYFFGN